MRGSKPPVRRTSILRHFLPTSPIKQSFTRKENLKFQSTRGKALAVMIRRWSARRANKSGTKSKLYQHRSDTSPVSAIPSTCGPFHEIRSIYEDFDYSALFEKTHRRPNAIAPPPNQTSPLSQAERSSNASKWTGFHFLKSTLSILRSNLKKTK